jgi:glycosyltransferase involved in cell wall biosynthesis
VGQFSWTPDGEAAEWLVQEVLPLLPRRIRVRLVCRSTQPRVYALAGRRVEVTRAAPDAWPHVHRAGVVLSPMRGPGGTRHEILAGLLAGRPVVATRAGAEGLEDLVGLGLVLADAPEAFAGAIAELSAAPSWADALGAAGRSAVVARHEWGPLGRRLPEPGGMRLGSS